MPTARLHAHFHFNRRRARPLGELPRELVASLRDHSLVDFDEHKVSPQGH